MESPSMSGIDNVRRTTGNAGSVETVVTKADLVVHSKEASSAPRISVSQDSIGRQASDDRTELKARASGLYFHYGASQALKNVSIDIPEHRVTALIGPSGCGKSTFLRCFNRMHDLTPGTRYQGEIMFYPDQLNLIGPQVDPIEVRMRIGMVFQKPNPFPKSIFDNVAYGLRLRGINNRSQLQ